MWDMTKGVKAVVVERHAGVGQGAGREMETVRCYVATLLDGTEVSLAPFGNIMPTPNQFMNWAWDVSGLPGRMFQRNMAEPDEESRFDPDRVFMIDRALVRQDIIAGEIFSFRRSYWLASRPVKAVMVTPSTVHAMEERHSPHRPVAMNHGRRGVRMLQLEDETCSG